MDDKAKQVSDAENTLRVLSNIALMLAPNDDHYIRAVDAGKHLEAMNFIANNITNLTAKLEQIKAA